MKIAIFDPYLDTMSGGEKYMLTAALSLAKEHDVTILWDKSQKADIAAKARRRFGFDLSNFIFRDSLFSRNISLPQRLLKSREYDAIFVLSDGSIPLVSCDLVLHFQSPMEWVETGSFLTRLKLSRVKKFVSNSVFTKEYIDKRFHVYSEVVYPPVFIRNQYEESKKEDIILNVGRFGITGKGSSLKKQDVLADIFSDFAKKKHLEGWKMVFVMSVMDQEEQACQEFVGRYKDDPIEFVINPTNEQLWAWYKKASIYWHASGFGEDIIKHPDRAEHFGISTVEAMGAGAVPVVISAGGQKEIVQNGENGYLWSTKEELIRKSYELIENKKKRKEMSEVASSSVSRYSQDEFERKIQAIFT